MRHAEERRAGYTIFEMIVVLAILLILGAVLIPSFAGYYGNTKQRAASDLLRTRLAEARAKAIEQGTPYRVAVNADRIRIRVAPDGDLFDSMQADNPPGPNSQCTEDTLDGATLELQAEVDDERTPSAGGWVTVVTMKATGDCRETRHALVLVKEKDFNPIQVEVRGITGQTRVTTTTKAGGQK